MNRENLNHVAIVALVLLLIIPAGKSDAIPAFARKYQISCQVCHSPAMPRLKAFGDEFAGNGFRMTEYESHRYLIPAGDDKLSLLRELPLAIRMDGFVSYNFNNEGQADFSSPYVLKILSGGELSDKLSYYFYFLFNERGSIAGVEDAFLMYRDLFGSGISFYIGQFQASDPLFKGELRYTLEPYQIYGTTPGNSMADLKYDRGIIFERDFKTGTTVVAQILNGSGIGEAGAGNLFDNDKYKNFMGRITQSIGPNLSIGLFGYTGRELLADPGSISDNIINELTMIGPDVSLNFGDKFVFNMQYVRRMDSQVYSEPGLVQNDLTTDGGFVELIFSPKGDLSNWYLTGLANLVDSDLDELDYKSATFHAGYILRRNVRLVSEFTQVFSPGSYGKVSVGVVSAF